MKAKLIGLGFLAVATGFAAPAMAQSTDDDVRCLLVSNAFAKEEKDPAKNQIARVASAFYLGRLDVRMSTAQLKTALPAMAKTITGTAAGPAMNTCVRRLLEKSGALGPAQPAPKPR